MLTTTTHVIVIPPAPSLLRTHPKLTNQIHSLINVTNINVTVLITGNTLGIPYLEEIDIETDVTLVYPI